METDKMKTIAATFEYGEIDYTVWKLWPSGTYEISCPTGRCASLFHRYVLWDDNVAGVIESWKHTHAA